MRLKLFSLSMRHRVIGLIYAHRPIWPHFFPLEYPPHPRTRIAEATTTNIATRKKKKEKERKNGAKWIYEFKSGPSVEAGRLRCPINDDFRWRFRWRGAFFLIEYILSLLRFYSKKENMQKDGIFYLPFLPVKIIHFLANINSINFIKSSCEQ